MNTKIFIVLSIFIELSFTLSAQNFLFKDDNSDYAIVIPSGASSIDSLAAAELQHFLFEISDVKLPIFFDDNYRGKSFISIGETSQMAMNKTTREKYHNISEQLRDDGFGIFTHRNKLFLVGNNGKAVLYAVYRFLQLAFDADMLTATDYYLPHLKQYELTAWKPIVENPAFSYREVLYLFPNQSQRYADWHHLQNRADMNSNWGMFVHTFQKLIPASDYFDTHPEWFSEVHGQRVRDGQLCLSNEKMLEQLCSNLEQRMNDKPEAKIWSVSQNDNINACTCDACQHLDSIYGGHSGTLIYFVNAVAQRFPDKIISTLAYQHTRKAPKNIKPLSNVNIMFCSIECQRQLPFEDNAAEKGFMNDMQQWTALTKNIFVWDYVIQFRNMLDPFPNLHVLQPNLQYFRQQAVPMMFEQGANMNVAEMMEWRTYLIAKLLWNPDIDVDSLSQKFLSRYYGKAAPFIADYMELMKNELLKSGQVLDIYGYPINAKKGYLSSENIEKYQTLFAKAYQAIQPDSVFQSRLRLLELSLDFAVLDLSMSEVSPQLSYFKTENGVKVIRPEMIQKAEAFVTDCERFGVNKLEEIYYPPQLFLENINNYIQKSMQQNLAYGKKVTLKTEWSEIYDVGGPQALTDGKYGIQNYHYNWLGFYGNHLDAIVDLDTLIEAHEINLDFFSYPLSWIFVPKQVEFFVSTDSLVWTSVGERFFENETILAKAKIYKMQSDFISQPIRYVRVKAQSLLTNPAWHRGYGMPCWIFTDEIVVK